MTVRAFNFCTLNVHWLTATQISLTLLQITRCKFVWNICISCNWRR